MVNAFLADLQTAGYAPMRVILFGSYANGRPHEHSDIDLAIWDERFTGLGTIDIVPILSIISKYPAIELHSYSVLETAAEDPFIGEIEKTGIDLTGMLHQAV